MRRTAGCIDESTAQGLVDGTLSLWRVCEANAHVDVCRSCRKLISELTRHLDGAPTLDGDDSCATPTEVGWARRGDVLDPGVQVDRYVIREFLGEGGMGVVYEADDPLLGRKVALKLIREIKESRSVREAWRARLLREARVIARLSQPNVIAVYDVGFSSNRIFMAMELVEGTTLRRWLAREPRSWREVVAVFVAAGHGLSAAHRAGVVHRDFKPENVMIGEDGRVRIMDFGLARLLPGPEAGTPSAELSTSISTSSAQQAREAESTRSICSETLMGTPGYVAPELFAGSPADAASDQFSFCVSLREALCGAGSTGRAGGTPAAAWKVPTWLRTAIHRGLSTDPSQRFASMDELLATLERKRFRSSISPPALVSLTVLAGLLLTGLIGSHAPERIPAAGDRQFTKAAEAAEPIATVSDRPIVSAGARLLPCPPDRVEYRAGDFDADGTADLLIRCVPPSDQPSLPSQPSTRR